MRIKYASEDLISRIKAVLLENPAKLYTEKSLTYTGKILDGDAYDTDVIAQYLLGRLSSAVFPQVTRQASYHTGTHDGTTPASSSSRLEDRIGMKMLGKSYAGLGTVLDYQVPLRNTNADKGVRAIDLVSFKEANGTLYLLELKAPKEKNQETLLRCAMEIYTYWRIVDHVKLAKDFAHPGATVVPAVLVPEGGIAHMEYLRGDDSKTVQLMQELGISFFALPREDMQV